MLIYFKIKTHVLHLPAYTIQIQKNLYTLKINMHIYELK